MILDLTFLHQRWVRFPLDFECIFFSFDIAIAIFRPRLGTRLVLFSLDRASFFPPLLLSSSLQSCSTSFLFGFFYFSFAFLLFVSPLLA